ncbi:EAL domain-containing protein [Sphingomicrobium astaxanthinifaciens]|uniref:EAL domain-containing protein n=1 Tax=Sphingomicrobium astaxanthinifaciens TaxID=1227949 RepID=UPI001FCBA4A4|nr:EAL domain-containing protein [Sphingomicrobium astaxanthinifaciens]MCJ7420326.1 EAL domain-containing protein [Sphingomicrobium astaxanthinifaciens]
MNRAIDSARPGRGKAPKLFGWTVVLGLLFGLLGLGQPLEDVARTLRNNLHPTDASGDIVVVALDRQSVEKIGAMPWPRSTYARLIEQANARGAEEIYFDLVFAGRSTPAEDAALERALAEAGNVVIAANRQSARDDEDNLLLLPDEQFSEAARLGSINAYFNFQTAVWDLAFAHEIGGRKVPTFAASLAEVDGAADKTFPLDYSIRYDSIPVISSIDLIEGRVPEAAVRGKKLIVGITPMQLGDQVFIPGIGRRGGVFVQVIGAETLLRGIPTDLGWLPGLGIAVLLLGVACFHPKARYRFGALVIGVSALPALAFVLETRQHVFDIVPGLTALLVAGGVLIYRFFKARGFVNTLTDLPNLAALRADKEGKSKPLIAAKVHNYAEIASTLNAAGEKRLVEQIVARLALGRQNGFRLYQGDEGIFAWFVDGDIAISHHLEALHALFRTPVRINQQPYDIAISFGVEMGSGRSAASRLGSALVAADEAENEAIKWKYHDPARLASTPWKLSLLSQLDEAIEKGEVWIALQPKQDLRTKRIVAAEALARWTHPEKGPISPIEFIAAAESNNRISKLTHFVLDEACKAVTHLRRTDHDFAIAVNLSARMLTDHHLVGSVLSMLDRHDLPAAALTLELTETAALAGSGADIELLSQLRAIGINISIDDYGTGLSTLEYLKKVPASEIKIDQSFVRSMRENRSDLIMVQSTIALAHSLGRKVVAEGVEDRQVLEQLAMLDCDLAQGFAIGRPMTLEEMQHRLERKSTRRVA